jgi:hypothetical protein
MSNLMDAREGRELARMEHTVTQRGHRRDRLGHAREGAHSVDDRHGVLGTVPTTPGPDVQEPPVGMGNSFPQWGQTTTAVEPPV